MMERLEVHGRDYLQVAAAAEFVGYSEAYVEKLAREKWVDATSIQGKYYIDLQSLSSFVAASERDLYEQASQQERRQRAENILQDAKMTGASSEDAWVLFSKTGVVALCGLLVGLLGWTMIEEGVQLADLQAGLMASTGQLLEIVSFDSFER